MADLNKVMLIGRLTSDPELKQTPSGVSVTSFSIAVNRRFNKSAESQQADFINIVAWRQSAEFITRYFKKGRSILIIGSLQTRTWQDQQGQKRYSTEVVVDEVQFVDNKPQENTQGSSNYTPDSYSAPSFSSDNAPNFEELTDEDDLPF